MGFAIHDINLLAFQEVLRIKNEHPDDVSAVTNDRVKGSLKVTRAFGAGFLKQVTLPRTHIFICIFMNK